MIMFFYCFKKDMALKNSIQLVTVPSSLTPSYVNSNQPLSQNVRKLFLPLKTWYLCTMYISLNKTCPCKKNNIHLAPKPSILIIPHLKSNQTLTRNICKAFLKTWQLCKSAHLKLAPAKRIIFILQQNHLF